MKIALIGAELEENLGLRYIAATLESNRFETKIFPFNSMTDIKRCTQEVLDFGPEIVGLSMVFTSRARDFLELAKNLRRCGYYGHITAGGHFASFNAEKILMEHTALTSIVMGEGELIMNDLANNPANLSSVKGLCFRDENNRIILNEPATAPQNLDELPFPLRNSFNDYFGIPIGSILSSRGCWRSCAFCSINAWYRMCGGKRFRYRSIENIAEEMKELYFKKGVKIFNFQDDNFFLPNNDTTIERFNKLRDLLFKEGIKDIAIAIKARPDSITYETISPLDDLGLFRVFLGVENASQRGLDNLNRQSKVAEIDNALKVLNDFDVHVAYNLLMFEPNTTMEDIRLNIRFMSRNIENPFNFCRAEAYAGTGLEKILLEEDRLLGDYYGFDYRLKDPCSETVHQIANYAFFDRNFNNNGLHYFNMQVDFYYQLLRRFFPHFITESLRAEVKIFIKQTNLDTFRTMSKIFDFVQKYGPEDRLLIRSFSEELRQSVDRASHELLYTGSRIIAQLEGCLKQQDAASSPAFFSRETMSSLNSVLQVSPFAYRGNFYNTVNTDRLSLFSPLKEAIPYDLFKRDMAKRVF